MIRGKTYYLLLLLLVTFFWGVTFPIIQVSLQFIGPVSFLAIRFAVSAGIMLPFVLVRKRENMRNTVKYSLIAGFLLFLGYYFQTVGLVYTTPAKSGIITGLYVVLLPLVSFTYLKKKVSRIDIIASMIAFSGLIIMSIGSGNSSRIQTGDLLTLVCAVAYTFQIAYVSKRSHEVDSVYFTFFQLLFVSVFSFAAIPTFEPYKFTINAYVVFTIIFTALFAGILAYYVSNRALIYVEPSAAGVIFVGEPVFAVISSVVITGEILGSYIIAGGSLMIIAMFITTFYRFMSERKLRPGPQETESLP